MGVVIKQSLLGSLLVYAGVVIGYVNTLLLMPYFLDVDQIGLIRLIQSNGMILIPLAIVGMNGSYIKYHPQFKDDLALKHRIFSFQIVLVVLGSILCSLFIYLGQDTIKLLFAENSAAYNDYLYATVVIFVSQSLFNYFISFLWSEFNVTFPNFLNEVFLRLASVVVVFAFGLGVISFHELILYLLSGYVLTTVILCVYIFIKHSVKFDWSFYRLDTEWLRKLFGFGGYTLLLTSCSSIVLNVSYLLTSSYLGLTYNGIFTVSFYIATIIELPKRVVSQIVSPVITRNFNENNLHVIDDALKRSSINLGAVSLLLSIGIITNMRDLYFLIPKGEEFSAGFMTIVVIALAKILNMFFGISPEILNFSKYYRVNLIITVAGALLMILFCVLLIPTYGMMGAAAGILLTNAFNNAVRHFVMVRKFGFNPFTMKHLYLVLIATATYVCIELIPFHFSPLFNIIWRSLLTSVIFISALFVSQISYEVNYIIKNAVSKISQTLRG